MAYLWLTQNKERGAEEEREREMAHNYFSVADERSDSQNGISNIKLNLK